MADLFWPGDERAGSMFDAASTLRAMVACEQSWSAALAEAGLAPPAAAVDLAALVDVADLDHVAAQAEASGTPVLPLLALLRERLEADSPEAARWLHRGLTSQDVVDTALVDGAQATRTLLLAGLDHHVRAVTELVREHRDHVMAGRTLTQHAVPVTFGLKAATWLHGLLDARDDVRALRFPVQAGGAAGTLAALVEIAGDADAARFVVAEHARALGLEPSVPWHTTRAPLTRYADALVRATDAMGRIANDVLALGRPEIGELAEPVGRGGSSTMPHKANPVLSVLIRRAALSAPLLAAQLHLAAAEQVDERADGAWHTEWPALASLSRHALAAAYHLGDLLTGLRVDTARMTSTAREHADDLLAERIGLRAALGLPDEAAEPADYLGAAGDFVEEILARAEEP